jgi:SSS family solute:Na+ symporter
MLRSVIALVIVLGTMISAWVISRKKHVNLQDWAVSGRGMGVFLFWFLSAGEIFTINAFLGGSGWAYAYGAPGFYIIGNVALAYTLGYWLLPKIWRIGKRHSLLTQADYYQKRFEAPWLGSVLAIVGIMALIPYLQLQFTGLNLILKLAFGTSVNTTLILVLAALIMLAFIIVAGLRSIAIASIVKDVFMIGILLGIALTIASVAHLGSIGTIFTRMNQLHPNYGWLPGMGKASKLHYTPLWFISTLLMTNLGFWMFPQSFQATLSARSDGVIRRNAIFQPLYALAYFFSFTIGFAALLVIPHLSNSNDALLAIVGKVYPGWFVGILAGAGILIALVPSSSLILTVGTLFANNIYRGILRPRASDSIVLLVSRLGAAGATIIAIVMSISSNQTIIDIFQVAYSAISQLAPGLLLSLLWRRITKWGVLAGVIVGIIGVTVPSAIAAEKVIAFTMNTDFVAVVLNALVTIVVSLLTRAPSQEAIAVGLETLAEAGDVQDALVPTAFATQQEE